MADLAVSTETALTWIIDPATGALVVEGLTAPAALALTRDLLPPPQPLNCARPLDAPAIDYTAAPITAAPESSPTRDDNTHPAEGSPVLRVARINHGSVVDGPGRRSVVQVQGCPIRCPGCYVPHTHDAAGGRVMPVEAAVLDRCGEPRDGITVTGGEPFAQPDALAALLRALRKRGLHTVVYSGHTLDALRRRPEPAVHAALRSTDLLVDGPFVAELGESAGEWRGSRNQRLIAHPSDAPIPHSSTRSIQA